MSFVEKQMVREFGANDVIFREKDQGDSMFIIQSGQVEVSTITNEQKVVLATLREGSIFGEMSLVDGRPRSATVKAISDVKCLEIGRMLFTKKLQEIPAWMRSFYQILVERLRESDKKQSKLLSEGAGKQVVYLLNFLLSCKNEQKNGELSIIWNEAAEEIAFLLDIPLDQVMRVMNRLSLTQLAKSEIHWEKGRLFVTKDPSMFQKFSEYCKERYGWKLGREISPEYEEKSLRETQLLKLIAKILGEQAGATDLDQKFFQNRLESDLNTSLDDYKYEINELVRRGILVSRVDENDDKYYDVNRELLDLRLGMSETLELFEKIERRIS